MNIIWVINRAETWLGVRSWCGIRSIISSMTAASISHTPALTLSIHNVRFNSHQLILVSYRCARATPAMHVSKSPCRTCTHVNDGWQWACIWWINLFPRQQWHQWPVCLINEFYPGGTICELRPENENQNIFSRVNCLWRVVSSSHKRIGQLCICLYHQRIAGTNLGNIWTADSWLEIILIPSVVIISLRKIKVYKPEVRNHPVLETRS